jgi:hypothetical protein
VAQPDPHQNPPAPADVAAILEQLRAEVRARRQALDTASDHDDAHSALERQLHRCAEQLEISRVVSAHWPLTHRSLPQRIGNFINKVVRRLLRWYINPIVEQQNAFNDTTARTLRLLIEGYSELLHQRTDTAPPPGSNTPDNSANSDNSDDPDDPDDGAPPPDTARLQARIEQQGAHEPPTAFTDLHLRPLLAELQQRQQINAHWHLEEHTPAQRATALAQRGIRFYLRWLINPIVEQQNNANAAVVETVAPLLAADAEVRAALAAQRARRAPPPQ